MFAAGLFLLTAVIYFPSLKGGFLAFDDEPCIVNNAGLAPSVSNAGSALVSSVGGLYQPLPSLSFMAERAAFGLNAHASRGINLLIHIAVSLVVLALALELGTGVPAAYVLAFLFALHPMHAESVAWISERKDLLCGFFYLLALLAYVRSRGEKGVSYLVWAFSLLALLSKVSAVTLPLALLAVDITVFRRGIKHALLEKLPLFALCAVFAVVNMHAHGSIASFGVHTQKWWEGLFVGARNLLFYPAKLFWPADLSPFYPYPVKINGLLPLQYYVAPALAGLACWAAWRLRAWFGELVLCGMLLYCVMVLPMLQLLPAGSAVAADHFSYLPSFGVLLAAVLLLRRLAEYMRGLEFKALYPVLLASFVLAGAGLCVMCWERARLWRSDLLVWSDVLSRYPDSSFALHNRAAAMVAAGRYGDAMNDYIRLLKLEPLDAAHHNDFGVAAVLEGDTDLALAAYSRAIELKPDYAQAYNNRGFALQVKGNSVSAKADLDKALSLDPSLKQVQENLALVR